MLFNGTINGQDYTEMLGENSVPVPLFTPHTSHILVRAECRPVNLRTTLNVGLFFFGISLAVTGEITTT
jgi:hypothetical protein